MSSSPSPRWPGQFDDNPGKRPKSSSSGAHMWRLLVDQFSAWGIGLLGMLGLDQ